MIVLLHLIGGAEGSKTSDGTSEDQCVDIMGTLVGVDSLQVHDVADDVVFVADTVASEHVTGVAGDIQGLAARVALDHGDHLGGDLALILQTANLQAGLETQGNLSVGIGHLLLHQLEAGQGDTELLAVQGVVSGLGQAELGSTEGTPGNTEAGVVQASERSLETVNLGEEVLGRDLNIVHHDHTGDRGTERELALDLGGRETLHTLFKDKALDLAAVREILGPDNKDVGNGRVGDPGLGAAQNVVSVDLAGDSLHRARVRTVVRLGQSEASDNLTLGC